MNRALALSAILATSLLSPTLSPPAEAAGAGGVRVEILVDGKLQRELPHDGRTYVEARKGKEYSIRLSNDSGERVAVALAVDGLNTIDGKHTTAREASKWVLGPWEAITVDGWQVTSSHARRFVFTTKEKSYGAWRGETRNLGVIDAVVFGERTRCCREPDPYSRRHDRDEYDGYGALEEEAPAPRGGRARESRQAEAPAADASAGLGDVAGGKRAKSKASSKPAPNDDLAATGSGRRTRNDVEWTAFDLDPSPRGTASLRYGFRSELLALGVIVEPPPRRDLRRRQTASGFAPEPPPYCCR